MLHCTQMLRKLLPKGSSESAQRVLQTADIILGYQCKLFDPAHHTSCRPHHCLSLCADGTTKTRWISEAVSLLPFAFPFRFRIVANGHRSRPNKRPLVWDVESRHVLSMPEDGYVSARREVWLHKFS